MIQLFASGGQTIRAEASASVLPVNIQGWFPLGWTGWISLLSKGLSRVFSSTSLKASILWHSAFFMVQHSYPWLLEKPLLWPDRTLLAKWCLCFLITCLGLSAFLPRSKCLLISWLQSPSAVIFGTQENEVCHCFHCFPFICHEVMGPDAMMLVFWMLSFKTDFSLSFSTLIKRLFSSS